MADSLAPKSSFLLDEEITFLNHGSFGTVPRPVYEARLKRMAQLEASPDDWFRYICIPLLRDGLHVVSTLIKCPQVQVVFVENATSGVTTALRSLNLTHEDGLLVTSLTYRGIGFTADRLCNDQLKATHHYLNLDPPFTDKKEVVERYRDYLTSNPGVKVAIVDHITSPSTLVLPVKDIVQVCREFNVSVIIDGAHAPGQLDIDVLDIGADFYTGNLHKWFFCPRGCAFLHVHPNQRDTVRPLLTSNSYALGFPDEFLVQGTRDDTSMVVVPEALTFINSLGGLETIQEHCSSLLEWAVNMLVETTGEPRLSVPKDMVPPYMAVVRFPMELQEEKTKEHGERIQKVLRDQYNINCAIDLITGQLYTRLSCGVYNTRQDYEKYSQALLDLKKHPEKLQHGKK